MDSVLTNFRNINHKYILEGGDTMKYTKPTIVILNKTSDTKKVVRRLPTNSGCGMCKVFK